MSSVDDRIVNMQFNNRQFTAGVSDSQRSLQTLEQQLAKTGTSGGLNDMATGVENVSSRFGALRIAGVAAIATIASKATLVGINMVKSMTLDPITAGFAEYQTNLNSIQTILANTGAPLKDVNANLQALNHYSDSTIYNFGQMASAIGKFTAAGVKLDDATSAIKGMANSAALSGASVDQLNSAMYQMSQALASGTIKLMDWNSLVNANMGGMKMQDTLKATAMSMDDNGAAMTAATTSAGNFRDSLQAGWLTADIFSKSMKVMGGQNVKTSGSVSQINDELQKIGYTAKEAGKMAPVLKKTGGTIAYTVQQLEKMGYSAAAAKTMHETSVAAIDAATKIKTLPQLMDVVKESIGSGWSKIFQDVFGNFTQSTKMWTNVGTTITGTIGQIFGAVDAMLVGWRKLGGYTELWASFGNIFKALGNLIHPFIAAFQALTPGASKAGSTMFKITHAFFLFTEMLVKVTDGVSSLTPIFVKVAGIIGMVFHQFSGLASLGSQLTPIFDKLGSSIGGLAAAGSNIAEGLLGGIISGLDGSSIKSAITNFAQNIIDWIKGALGIHSPSQVMIEVGRDLVLGIAQGLFLFQKYALAGLGKLVGAILGGIDGLFKGFDAFDFAALFNMILTGGLIFAVKKSVDTLTSFKQILTSITGVIDGVGKSLKVWQNSLKAKMIMDIAIAVGILVASLVVLSLLNPKQIAIGMGALTSMMALLSGTLLALSKINTDKQMAILATSLLLISAAMIQFSAAIILLGNQDMATLEKGIGAMAAVLALLMGAMLGFSKISGSIAGMAGAMLIMAFAMNVLAAAVLAFGMMDMKTLEKGLGGVAVGLALMVGTLLALSVAKGSVEGAAGSILIMSAAMVVLAAAVLAFGEMNMKTLAKGFGAVAVGLGLMVGALLLLSGNSAGVLAASASMVLMATAMNMMVGVILILGAAPWEVVARGLAFVAATLAIFLLAAAGAMIVAPGLSVLGTSMLMLGAAMWLAGTGMAAFAAGFAIMAATGVAGTVVIIGFIHALLAILPEIAVQAAASFIAFFKVLANASAELRVIFGKIFSTILGVISDNIPKIVDLVVKFVSELIDGVVELIPKFGKLIKQLITTGLSILVDAIPKYVNAGATIVTGVLQGLADKLPKMLDAAGNLIVAFIVGLGKQASKIVDAAGKTILKFLDGLDKAIVKYEPQILAKGGDIAKHLVEGLVKGVADLVNIGKLTDAIKNLVGNAVDSAKHFLGIGSPSKVFAEIGKRTVEGLTLGIKNSTISAVNAVLQLVNLVIAAGSSAVLLAQEEARKIQNKAYMAQANADMDAAKAREAAKKVEHSKAVKEAEKHAKNLEKAANSAQKYAGKHKKDKEAQKKAKRLQNEADKAQKHVDKVQAEAQKKADQAQKIADKTQKKADNVQSAADAAAQKVADAQAFEQADLHGKGDIKDANAIALADRAQQMLAKANAEAARAHELMKTNRKAGLALLAKAKADAAEAKRLADEARQSHKDALAYYAQEVNDRIKAMADAAQAEQDAADWQARYDAASDQGKADLLAARAAALEAKAAALKADAASYIAQAKVLASTDAAEAMRLLDLADVASQAAQEAADSAEQDRSQVQQLLTDPSSTTTTSSGGSGGPSIAPSRSVLEDAASIVDRYTQSLLQATEAAAAQQSVVQFVQNNTSPVALSPSEIYRQSRNLLSTAELKMGVVP